MVQSKKLLRKLSDLQKRVAELEEVAETEATRVAEEREIELTDLEHAHETELAFLKLNPDDPFNISLADMWITDGDAKLPAHKLVLASRSPILSKLFKDEGTQIENKKIVVKIQDTSMSIITSVVRFCYTGKIEFTDDVPTKEVLKVAHNYQIDLLKNVCSEELIDTITNANVEEISRLSDMYDMKSLREAASDYKVRNFDPSGHVVDDPSASDQVRERT